MVRERDYSKLSPRELQAEFSSLLTQFPPDGSRWEITEKMDNPNHKQNVFTKIILLLDFSPTSQSFKDILLSILNMKYNDGTLFFIDETDLVDQAESVGLFSQERAQQIERKLYLGITNVALRRLAVNGFQESLDASDDLMANWRQEFIQLYGDEP